MIFSHFHPHRTRTSIFTRAAPAPALAPAQILCTLFGVPIQCTMKVFSYAKSTTFDANLCRSSELHNKELKLSRGKNSKSDYDPSFFSLLLNSDVVGYLKTQNPRENPDFFATRIREMVPEPEKWYLNLTFATQTHQ